MDRVVSGDDLAELVSTGEMRYIYWGGESGPLADSSNLLSPYELGT